MLKGAFSKFAELVIPVKILTKEVKAEIVEIIISKCSI